MPPRRGNATVLLRGAHDTGGCCAVFLGEERRVVWELSNREGGFRDLSFRRVSVLFYCKSDVFMLESFLLEGVGWGVPSK